MITRATKPSFHLTPYVGVNDVRFGMQPAEVSLLLGPPDVVDLNGLGELDQCHGLLRVAFGAHDEGVVEFGLTPTCSVIIDGVSLFDADDPIAVLIQFDPDPRLLFGFLVFQAIGITLTGFHDADVSQRAVCLFARGRFDRFSADMTPYVLG
jgi:hypothetical protein